MIGLYCKCSGHFVVNINNSVKKKFNEQEKKETKGNLKSIPTRSSLAFIYH